MRDAEQRMKRDNGKLVPRYGAQEGRGVEVEGQAGAVASAVRGTWQGVRAARQEVEAHRKQGGAGRA